MQHKRRYLWLLLCCLSYLFIACSGTPQVPKKAVVSSSPTSVSPTVAPTSTPASVAGGPDCKPASPVIIPQGNQTPAGVGLPQVEGKAHGGDLWALIFNGWPMQANKQNKIVWRMTGNGSLDLVAYGPGRQVAHPSDLIYHDSSSWSRPGMEWGSSFIFPVAGCWDIRATREDLTGDVLVVVR